MWMIIIKYVYNQWRVATWVIKDEVAIFEYY